MWKNHIVIIYVKRGICKTINILLMVDKKELQYNIEGYYFLFGKISIIVLERKTRTTEVAKKTNSIGESAIVLMK